MPVIAQHMTLQDNGHTRNAAVIRMIFRQGKFLIWLAGDNPHGQPTEVVDVEDVEYLELH